MATRKPLVHIAGRIQELPAGDSISSSDWPLVKNSVAAGETLTIPAGYQLVCGASFTINDTGLVDNHGDLVIV